GVLGPGARPEHALTVGAFAGQRLPPGPTEEALVAPVGELGIGNRHLAEHAVEESSASFVDAFAAGLADSLFHLGVNTTDEETGYRGQPSHLLALLCPPLEPTQVGLRNAGIRLLAEEERDVDVDAFADALLDGRDTLGRAGDFNHHIRRAERLPKPARLVD